MQRRSILGAIIVLGLALATVSLLALLSTTPASAQCGSQASSCMNCHETQGKDSVNADGTGWHQSHAFGDFCYLCHGGNSQATEADAAHVGMVAPMSDVQTSCAQCHPNDLQARADVYTVALGLPAASVRTSAPAANPAPTANAAAPAADSVSPAPAAALPANDPNLVDYVARYDQQVLNQNPTNWGNVILGLILLGMLGAGLYLINRREGWISISFKEKKSPAKEYAADVLAIADQVDGLPARSRLALTRLLNRPAAADVLAALDRLSTDSPSVDKE